MSDSLKGIKFIEDFDLKGKCVFMRLDLNVPLKDGKITDDTRIQAALPSIKYALNNGAKLVLASHLGRPKTEEDRDQLSLDPVAERLHALLGIEVILVEDPKSDAPKALVKSLTTNQIVLLENLRFDKDETKNGTELAHTILEYTDIYINDAFGASHRAHASVVGVPSEIKNKGIGFLVKKEIEMLDHLLYESESPFVMILGGAKVSDKIPVIENLIDRVDTFIIGGAMAYTFLAANGTPVGKSLVEKDKLKFAKELMKRIKTRGKKLLIPIDHLVTPDIKNTNDSRTTKADAIDEGWMGVDIGPKTTALYKNELARAKTIFWNGPMGVFETLEFSKGTFAIAETLADLEARTIIGGGDSAAAVKASGFAEKMEHISTGGGASLEYLQGIPLPGLEALRDKLKRSEKEEGKPYL